MKKNKIPNSNKYEVKDEVIAFSSAILEHDITKAISENIEKNLNIELTEEDKKYIKIINQYRNDLDGVKKIINDKSLQNHYFVIALLYALLTKQDIDYLMHMLSYLYNYHIELLNDIKKRLISYELNIGYNIAQYHYDNNPLFKKKIILYLALYIYYMIINYINPLHQLN